MTLLPPRSDRGVSSVPPERRKYVGRDLHPHAIWARRFEFRLSSYR